MEKGWIWRNLEAPWAQDGSDQRHSGRLGAEWGNVHLEKEAVAPSSRTQPSPLPGSQPLAFGVAVPRLVSLPLSCLFTPQRSSLSSPRLHFWSRWRLWCPRWTARISKVPLHCSAWGGGWMGGTSLCLRFPGLRLGLLLVFIYIYFSLFNPYPRIFFKN